MALGGFFGSNFGAAAGGALQGQSDYQAMQANQLRLQQMREQQVKEAAAANAQRAATEAFQKTMQSAFGTPGQPQAPAPGAPSVPMAQPPQLQPYRALQPGQPAPMPGQVVLPQRPQAPAAPAAAPAQPVRPQQITMQGIQANAPSDPDAYRLYMEQMAPYMSSQDKAAALEQKQQMELLKIQNNFMLSQARLANATTPEERKQARDEANELRRQMVEVSRERADTQKSVASEKVTKGSDKRQAQDVARQQAVQLIAKLRGLVRDNPGVVGLRGKASRLGEGLTGLVGADVGTAASDFEGDIRKLQNIIKNVEPYGPRGQVLKGELADRDAIVKGLGSFTSPNAALSSFDELESLLNRTGLPPAESAGESRSSKSIPTDRNQVIKDVLTKNGMDANNPADVKEATEFAKSKGWIK